MTKVTITSGTDNAPFISVALCTWNGAAHLDAQLDSILAQQGVRLELVVLDDASTDNTWARLEARAAQDARIRLYRNATNLGHLRSFEKCMALANADWIAPADQDDVWALDKLSRLHEVIGLSDLAYCDSAYIDEDGTPLHRSVSDELVMFSGLNPVPLFFQNTVSGHASLIRKSLLTVAGPAPDGFYHDWWLALSAAGRNGVVYLDAPLVKFRRHENACTTLGRGKGDCASDRRNSKWLECLATVGRSYATTGLRQAAFAGEFSEALLAAYQGRLSPAWRLLWANRNILPPAHKAGWYKAIKLWSRIRRKAKRARLEPAAAPVQRSLATKKLSRQ